MSPAITPERWKIIEPLVDGALERVGEQRVDFLATLDTATRCQVEEVVAECDQPSVLDGGAIGRFAEFILEQSTPPAVLGGRYHVQRVLGRGGMATVYLAHDSQHARSVAVKVLSLGVTAFLTRERFLAEIQIAARLTHPHILGVHDSGETDEYLYYAMPYVDGESLRHRLRREQRLPVAEALTIAREIADALAYAHRQGVVHRDIKPENVLLESGHAVVADFGIAQAIGVATESRRAVMGFATGTPAYMSPEQATGAKDIDARTDIYSLSCVLYEMLAGEPPFNGPTTDSIVHQHLTATPRTIASLRPDTPTWVTTAIERGLAKRPADRFDDAATFGASLLPPAESKRSSRNRRAALLAMGGAAIVGALVFSVLSQRPLKQVNGAATRGVAPDQRARDAYANGIFHLNRRTAVDQLRAIEEFQHAVGFAPKFAAAHARLAATYARVGYFGYPGAPPASEAFARADSALRTALELDSLSAEAQLARAQLRWMHAPNIPAALASVHRALELDSQLVEAHFEHGRIHAMLQESDSAIAAMRRTRELEATSPIRQADIAWVYWIVRRDSEAVVLARQALELDSTTSTAYLALGGGLAGLGERHKAIEAFEKGLRLSRGNTLFLPQLGHAYARTGQHAKARAILARLIELHRAGRASPYYVAQVYIGLANRDSALAWLGKAEAEESGHVAFVRANPVWDEIRNEPAFRVIVKRVGLN